MVDQFHPAFQKFPHPGQPGGPITLENRNEGFNLQKNGGFFLEHAYSLNETAHKVFYLLLQITMIFFQLMVKSQFFNQTFPKGVGSLKNIAYRLLEAWRNLRLDDQAFRHSFGYVIVVTIPRLVCFARSPSFFDVSRG